MEYEHPVQVRGSKSTLVHNGHTGVVATADDASGRVSVRLGHRRSGAMQFFGCAGHTPLWVDIEHRRATASKCR